MRPTDGNATRLVTADHATLTPCATSGFAREKTPRNTRHSAAGTRIGFSETPRSFVFPPRRPTVRAAARKREGIFATSMNSEAIASGTNVRGERSVTPNAASRPIPARMVPDVGSMIDRTTTAASIAPIAASRGEPRKRRVVTNSAMGTSAKNSAMPNPPASK